MISVVIVTQIFDLLDQVFFKLKILFHWMVRQAYDVAVFAIFGANIAFPIIEKIIHVRH